MAAALRALSTSVFATSPDVAECRLYNVVLPGRGPRVVVFIRYGIVYVRPDNGEGQS